MFYAQLDNNNVVIGISELSDEINSHNLIKINEFDIALIKKVYNSDTNAFEQFSSSVKLLDTFKKDKINELNQKCADAISAGFKSYALGIEHVYPSDNEAQANLQMAIKRMEIDSTKTKIGFKTLDAGYLDHTLDQLHKVFADGFDYGQQQIIKYNQLKTQVLNLTTAEEVNKITW